MTQKPLGYVELEWTCKRCGTRNPGLQKTCSGCGSAMSEQDKFEAPVQQELITDEEKLAAIKKGGPDVHCPYCGARSPAGSQKCVQCGAALGDAKAREAGQVVGAYEGSYEPAGGAAPGGTAPSVAPSAVTGAAARPKPAPTVNCPYCGQANPARAVKCSKCGGNLSKPSATPAQPAATGFPVGLAIGIAVVVLLLCAGGIFLTMPAKETVGVVEDVRWQLSIEIKELRPVQREDWEDEIPAGADKGECQKKQRSTQSQPAPGAEEVCGEPYTVDQGDGTGKVVQDCEYIIYDDWCEYKAEEWTVVDKAVAEGGDLNPRWPSLALRSNQREGNRSEQYEVVFGVDDKQGAYTYSVNSVGDLSKFKPGSRWTLQINRLGAITGVEPAN